MIYDFTRRVGVVLGSIVFFVTALATAVATLVDQVAPELPQGWQDNAVRVGGLAVSALTTAALAVRRLTEVDKSEHGFLPPEGS